MSFSARYGIILYIFLKFGFLLQHFCRYRSSLTCSHQLAVLLSQLCKLLMISHSHRGYRHLFPPTRRAKSGAAQLTDLCKIIGRNVGSHGVKQTAVYLRLCFRFSLLQTRIIRVHRRTSLQKAASPAVGYHGDAAHAASTDSEPTPGQSPVSG